MFNLLSVVLRICCKMINILETELIEQNSNNFDYLVNKIAHRGFVTYTVVQTIKLYSFLRIAVVLTEVKTSFENFFGWKIASLCILYNYKTNNNTRNICYLCFLFISNMETLAGYPKFCPIKSISAFRCYMLCPTKRKFIQLVHVFDSVHDNRQTIPIKIFDRCHFSDFWSTRRATLVVYRVFHYISYRFQF